MSKKKNVLEKKEEKNTATSSELLEENLSKKVEENNLKTSKVQEKVEENNLETSKVQEKKEEPKKTENSKTSNNKDTKDVIVNDTKNIKNELKEETAKNLEQKPSNNSSEDLEQKSEKTSSEEKTSDENEKETYNTTFEPIKKKSSDVLSVFALLVVLFIVLLLVAFLGFTIFNIFNTNIISGVHIKGINVAGLSPSDAKYQLDNYLSDKLPEEIKLKHGDFETTLSLSQMDIAFDTKKASDKAYEVGREGNIFENNLQVLSMMFGNVNIEPKITFNKQLLSKNLEDLSSQLPDSVVQSSYYVENNELIITSGKAGNIVDVDNTIEAIKNSLSTFSASNEPIEIAVKTQEPDQINVEQIYNEIHKDPVDAYYTTEPFEVHPSENGIDFKVSLEEAKAMISSEAKEEYVIPLNIIYPRVTTNMIGTEAFPDMLSTFSTHYAASNRNRTTNLILASNKINGTVLMPGETFSYNKVVGARTIAAGYKEAPIYVQGRVEDGLGGGICQITSTLYNAVVYANLEVTQRTNHQFVPSYVTASRDATVVYGALDFQFKNNRNYPIKLVSSVANGVATFQIFGLRQEDDFEVEISAYQTGRTATAIYSEAYKILKRNGQVVDRQLLSKDTYKRH